MLNRLLQRSNDGNGCGGEIMTARSCPTSRTAAHLTASEAGDRQHSRQSLVPEMMADSNWAYDVRLKDKGVDNAE